MEIIISYLLIYIIHYVLNENKKLPNCLGIYFNCFIPPKKEEEEDAGQDIFLKNKSK